MVEKSLYASFGRFIRDKWKDGAAVFELKITKTKRFRLSSVLPHQERSLRMTQSKTGIYYKIPDLGLGQKPFDSFFLANIPAYVVVCFYAVSKKQHKPIYFIPITVLINFQKTYKDKSITEDQALILSSKMDFLA